MAAAQYTTPSLSCAEKMHTSLSGADQLKEERLRFVAATAHHASEVSCDVSSEGDTESSECDSPSKLTVEVAAPTSVTMSAAGSSHQGMACYDQLPEPATIVAAVRDMLQQHGTVSSATCENLPKSLLSFQQPVQLFPYLVGEPREMQQQLQSMLSLAKGSSEAAAAAEYMQQVTQHMVQACIEALLLPLV